MKAQSLRDVKQKVKEACVLRATESELIFMCSGNEEKSFAKPNIYNALK